MAGKTEKDDILGIYISSKHVALAKVNVSSGKISVPHLVKFPTNFENKEHIIRPLVLNNAFFNEKAPWINPFRQALKKVNWKARRAVISLSNEFAILRYFTMPHVERKFWHNSVPLESKKYVPVSFEEVSYHFYANPRPQDKKLEVLFALTKKKSVEFLMDLLKKEGLELESVEASPFSFERLVSFLNPEHAKSGYVHFTKEESFTLFSSNEMPILFRENNFAASAQMTGRRSLDLKGALQFISRYVGNSKYSSVLLSGDNLEVWQASASRESPVEVRTWDLEKRLSLKENNLPSIYAIGAAAKDLIKQKVFIDMSGLRAGEIMEKKVISYVKNITIAFVSFFLLLTLVNHVRIYMVSNKMRSLYAKLGGDISEFQGKDPSSIENETQKYEEDARFFGDLLFDKSVLAPKLEAIADALPKYLWIESIIYINPLSAGGIQASPKEMHIRGLTNLSGNLRIKFVQKLEAELKKNEAFKDFAPPRGQISSSIDEQAESVSDGMSEIKEKVYGFTVDCMVKPRGN